MPGFEWNKRWGQQAEAFRRGDRYFSQHATYGYQWGDPTKSSASFVIPEYIEHFLKPGGATLEIGPGGGRYSQFLLKSARLVFVEYNKEFFPILEEKFRASGVALEFVHSVDCSIKPILQNSIDFVFSFDCFVHLDIELIEKYLVEIGRVLKPDGTAVIHYADKRKELAQKKGTDFSPTTPDIMRALVRKAGFRIKKEDTERISHSAIVAFGHAS